MIRSGMRKVWGENPGQLMRLISAAKMGELMDCSVRVICRSMGKDGVDLTNRVKVVNAPTTATRPIWNRYVRYSRFGREVTSAFATCCAASFAFSTGFSVACSAIVLSFQHVAMKRALLREREIPGQEAPPQRSLP